MSNGDELGDIMLREVIARSGFTVEFCNYLVSYCNNYVAVITHFNSCNTHNCDICTPLCSIFINYLHYTVGFQPLAPLPASSNSLPVLPALTSNINSYVHIQNYFTGSPNFISKVAPVVSHINFKLLGELSQGFYDTQILDLIQYGFPLKDKPSFLPNFAVTNHGSALQFPAEVDSYFREESHFGAMLGPFPDPPFPDLHCSPLMTAPKDGNKRRIIADLSFPSAQGHAVNLSVPSNS
jgi:hypothetical protein